MAIHQINQNTKVAALDPIWDRVRQEAEDIVRREPELASFLAALPSSPVAQSPWQIGEGANFEALIIPASVN